MNTAHETTLIYIYFSWVEHGSLVHGAISGMHTTSGELGELEGTVVSDARCEVKD
jgi:hypothetical protein